MRKREERKKIVSVELNGLKCGITYKLLYDDKIYTIESCWIEFEWSTHKSHRMDDTVCGGQKALEEGGQKTKKKECVLKMDDEEERDKKMKKQEMRARS